MANIALLLDLTALRAPNDVAVVYGADRLSYRDLHDLAGRVAAGLREAGVGAGDKVALSCPNRPEFIATYYGILKTGAVVIPLSTYLKRPEIAHQLTKSDASALICHAGDAFADHLLPAFEDVPTCERLWAIADKADAQAAGQPSFRELIARRPDGDATALVRPGDTASINFTSGTTGEPKGVEVSHSALLYQVVLNQGLAERSMSRVRLVLLPLFHMFSQVLALNLGVFSGERLVLMDGFEAGAALDLMRREGVNHVAGIPQIFQALTHFERISQAEIEAIGRQLKLAPCGGAPLTPALSTAFEERFGVPLREGYGLTETTSVVTWHIPGAPIKARSVGIAMPGCQVRIADGNGAEVKRGEVGRILVRTPGMMTGYYKDPDATQSVLRDGWLDTRDVGRLDADGYLQLLGRCDDMILRASAKVMPAEIEPVLEQHPAVAQAVVVGVPDPDVGQEVKAVIVLCKGESVTPMELADWARSRISEDRYPRMIEIRASLPLTGTGKVLKEQLV
ncbi:MAG: AMP-binding protein [Alphaproteobacteria bacterium]|nr:AMP-binding protein [Alphaproteobacteria bacterium]